MCWGEKTPKPSQSNAGTCPPGSTSPPCPCAGARITSETVATSPANRARTKVGVGEEVTLTYSLGSATWTITSGTGTLSPTSGVQTTFTAGDTAGSVTITATDSAGCSATIMFNVVEPSNWTMKRRVGSNVGHTNGRPTCSWFGTMKIHPNDVNFYRVETRELNSTISVSGSYNVPGWVGLKHQGPTQTESNFFSIPITSHTEAEGSEVAMEDNIDTGDPGPAATGAAPPFTPGRHSFPITWQWKVLGGTTIRNFPEQRQEAEIFSNGRCESRKGGNPESTMFSDPTSTR